MKLTYSRLCTALTTERVDKLLYIQVNCRVLRRPLHAIKKQADEEEDIIMDLEVEDLGHADEDEVGDVACTTQVATTSISAERGSEAPG